MHNTCKCESEIPSYTSLKFHTLKNSISCFGFDYFVASFMVGITNVSVTMPPITHASGYPK
jgi:hypothetical protein